MNDYKAIESGKDYLSHHGVKGMKWGIRHDPVPSGEGRRASKKLKKSINSTVRKVAKGLKRASRTGVKTAKRIRNRNLQRKIEKAIASGNSTRINKVFSKMNDAQAARAVVRINQREAVLRARAEDGKRSLKNINMQRKLDTLNLRNQYNKAKHPNLYTIKDNTVNNGSKIVSTKLATAMSEAVINKAKKIASSPDKIIKEAEKAAETVSTVEEKNDQEYKVADYITRLQHSDFMDIGEDFIAHHGVKGMKWGIRHDMDRVSNLRFKKNKNQSRLDKARGKRAKFNTKHRSLTARKAEIRLAKGKDPGLLGRLALTKSKKLDYKIAKLERKDAKIDKKIKAINKNIDTQIKPTKEELSYLDPLSKSISKIKGMKPYVTKRDALGRPTEWDVSSSDPRERYDKASRLLGEASDYDEVIAENQYSNDPEVQAFVKKWTKKRDKLVDKAQKYIVR